ncbi:hypothetical protein BD414DRAFT_50251 [Trametes punicea]|nr:hypothetical protein BD414DRAFT_50251 [Trametes punicea]
MMALRTAHAEPAKLQVCSSHDGGCIVLTDAPNKRLASVYLSIGAATGRPKDHRRPPRTIGSPGTGWRPFQSGPTGCAHTASPSEAIWSCRSRSQPPRKRTAS